MYFFNIEDYFKLSSKNYLSYTQLQFLNIQYNTYYNSVIFMYYIVLEY